MLSLLEILLLSLSVIYVTANTGDVTFYDPGLGACGIQNSSKDLIAAVSAELFNTFPGATSNPNTNPVCRRQLIAKFKGKSVTVTVTDKCPGCVGLYDLDMSPAAFAQLADPAAGRLRGVTWNFVDAVSRRTDAEATRDAVSKRGHKMVRRRRTEAASI